MDLLHELRSSGEVAIDRWISDRVTENLHFDCKRKADPSSPQISKEDKRNLAKVCVAFANSEGGLVLWGVDSRKAAGQDCLQGKCPIAEVDVFRNNLELLISDIISPPIPGLTIYSVKSGVDPSAGFVAIEVPASENRPHLSRNNDAPGFYFRNGHQSFLMEVFQIRDQMLRRTNARLSLEWRPRISFSVYPQNVERDGCIAIYVELFLKNESLVSARFPYLRIKTDAAVYLGMGQHYSKIAREGLPLSDLGDMKASVIQHEGRSLLGARHYSGGTDTCVHPGTELAVVGIHTSAPVTQFEYSVQGSVFAVPRYSEIDQINVSLLYGCQDSVAEALHLTLTAADIYRRLFDNGLAGKIRIR